MFTAFVHVNVDPERTDEFLAITRDNHEHSLREPGCLRFDVLRDVADPGVFYLYEVYRDEDAARAHKDTEHYARWNRAVAPMMTADRHSKKASSVFYSG